MVPAPFVDNLLNLNGSNPIPKLSEMKVQPNLPSSGAQSFDLLGSFDASGVTEPTAAPFSTGPAPDLLGGGQKLDILDDIFSNPPPAQQSTAAAGNGRAFNITSPLRPNANQTESPAQQAAAAPQKPADPFSTFGNITSDWLGFAAGSSAATKPSSAPSTQRTSPSNGNAPQQPSMMSTPPMTSPRYPSTPVNQRTPNEQPTRPDYSRSNFGVGGAAGTAAGQGGNGNQKAAAAGNGGAAPAGAAGGASTMGGDIFGDILGSQGYSFASRPANSTRSINEMRKEEMVKEMDPEKIKILDWVRSFN